MLGRVLVVCSLALGASGCPGKAERTPPPAPEPCKRFGDRCEFSPGKLGSCVERTNCTDGDCLVCQSQH